MVLKWGGVLISKYGIAIEHMKQKELFLNRQYHSFSAFVDAGKGYDIKESITDIQQTME